MTATWDEASKCPSGDGYQGKVVERKTIGREGQLITLECPATRCEFAQQGWIVQVRPDNTIPDITPIEQREKSFAKTSMSSARKQLVIDALAQQVENEQRAGSEVQGLY